MSKEGVWDGPGRPVLGMHAVHAAALPAVGGGSTPPAEPFALVARHPESARTPCSMTVVHVSALSHGPSRAAFGSLLAAADMSADELGAAGLLWALERCVCACVGEDEWQRLLEAGDAEDKVGAG